MIWASKVAVVTGGASGIGEATALEFAEHGAAVAILDINEELGTKITRQLSEAGHKALFMRVDVSDAEACVLAVHSVAARWGNISFLVNCAVSFVSKGIDVTTQDWERCLGVNIRGTANMAQACFRHMAEGGGGAIVNISSISAHAAQPNRWTYNATKGAVIALTKCQALDLSPYNIRVNAVSPGWTWTPEVARAAEGDREHWEPIWGKFSIMRRFGEPREIARAILFLCSDDASFITGTELAVDGGYTALGSEGLGSTSSFAGTA